ncbi:hypothetical protein [Emcibacter sp.]|uniref:hypothetical protein n=1 Tax=Emcibacter sp. TaxID=1979954 RepID=UPI003A8E3DBE
MIKLFRRKQKPDFHLLFTNGDESRRHACFLQQEFVSMSADRGKSDKVAYVVRLEPPLAPGAIGQDRSVERVVLLPLHQGQRLDSYRNTTFRNLGVMIFGGQYFAVNNKHENIDALPYVSSGVIERL